MDLTQIRGEIDTIDNQIKDLFLKRMEYSKKVAKFKEENRLPVIDYTRELDIVRRLTENCDDMTASYVKQLFTVIFDTSRSAQSLLLKGGELKDEIAAAMEATPKSLAAKASVAVQGIEGANSSIACSKLFSRGEKVYFKNFEGVFSAVESGLCEYGILPLENSIYGSVANVYDLMKKYKCKIIRSTRMKIDHALLAPKGILLENIKEIISHEQAIGQCSEFLKNLKNVKATECSNTAVAAQTVALSERNDLAAIASPVCASLYDLAILKNGIENNGNNYTRFIVISKKLEIYPGANKISVMLNLPHEPGSLYRVITKFSALGINLTKLESRPVAGRDFEFMFYIEADADIYSPETAALLGSLESVEFLGAYTEV